MRWVRPFIIAVAVLAGCVAVVYGVVGRRPTVTQPIAFNHAVHVGEASLTCVDCHTDAGTRRDAGLPGKQVCLDCHDPDQEAGKHPEKDKLFAIGKSDGEIPWIR
ncbi:MAG: cytochrome c3 family protein, partial [Planctomycetota bacterium]